MKKLTKKYSAKHVDMIIAAATVVEAAINNKAFLQSKRSAWADPFFEKLEKRIDNVAQHILGADNAKQLREATHTVKGIQKNALTDLAEARVQIAEDFKKTPERSRDILKQLGFTDYYSAAGNKGQEALVQLLFRFKENLTDALRSEIETAGTDAAVLVRIKGYADVLKKAEVKQETFKSGRTILTAKNTEELNNIYDMTISICKIASRFLKDQPAVKAQFSFHKIIKNQGALPKSEEPEAAQV